MSEQSVTGGGGVEPATVSSLADDLKALGIRHGDTVMVHTSLRSLGYVIGGAQAVLDALRLAVGEGGTLVMPTQSWQLCDPAFLNEPHVPKRWWPAIRDHLPAYDPARTPTQTMGAVAELFRTQPGTRRSAHPHRSISANGPLAAELTAIHDLDCPAGERSPLSVLYDHGARVLLLGVQANKATVLHLAEYRASYASKHVVGNGGPVLVEGERRWLTWEEIWVDDHDFIEVVAAFAQAHPAEFRSAVVGAARSQLLSMRPLIDFAAAWFTAHR